MCRYTKIATSGWGWRESNDCRWHQGHPKKTRRGCAVEAWLHTLCIKSSSDMHQRSHDDLRFFSLAGASCDCIPNNVLKAAVGVVEVQI